MFTFVYPDVLIFMLIPIFVLIYLIATNKKDIDLVFSKEMLERLKRGQRALGDNSRNAVLFFALILMIVALARPVKENREIEVEKKGV